MFRCLLKFIYEIEAWLRKGGQNGNWRSNKETSFS